VFVGSRPKTEDQNPPEVNLRVAPRIIFVAECLFFLGTTFLWLRLDRSAPAWDDAYYLTRSLVLFDSLTEGGVLNYARRCLNIMDTKPPLIAALPTPVYLLLGRKFRAAYILNLIFLLVIFVALYRMGKRYASPRAGIIAAFVAATTPMIYSLSHWFLVECGLIAMVCAAMSSVSADDNRHSTLMAFLLGTACGLGLLLKTSFPAYVLVPLVYLAITARPVLLHPRPILMFLAPAVVIASPWYALNFRHALKTAVHAGSSQTASIYQTGEIFSWKDTWEYLVNVANAAPVLYLIGALVLAALAGALALSSSHRKGLLLCALWASPLLLLALSHYRDLRYAAPLYPALALAFGIFADAALRRRRHLAIAVLSIVLILPLISMLQTSFGVPSQRPWRLAGLLLVPPRLDYARKFDPNEWSQPRILADVLAQTSFQGQERRLVAVATDRPDFNADNFLLATIQNRIPFDVETTAHHADLARVQPLIDSAAYVIYREGGASQPEPFNPVGPAAVESARRSSRFREIPIANPQLDDSSTVRILARLLPARSLQSSSFASADTKTIPPCNVTFSGDLSLTGLGVQQSGETLEVKYRWQCIRPVARDYWCFTHILDSSGSVIGYLDHPLLGGYPPTSAWKAGDEAAETLVFRLLPASPQKNETFHLRLGLFDRPSGERLPITSSDFPLVQNRTAALTP
jgi:4-amino-4-deoxy-L-arabinose transferase-like glycosyltransferase